MGWCRWCGIVHGLVRCFRSLVRTARNERVVVCCDGRWCVGLVSYVVTGRCGWVCENGSGVDARVRSGVTVLRLEECNAVAQAQAVGRWRTAIQHCDRPCTDSHSDPMQLL